MMNITEADDGLELKASPHGVTVAGIRMVSVLGGESMHRTAMSVAGERKFRDFRRDNKLDTRQFQMAFRTLRQLSVQIDSSRAGIGHRCPRSTTPAKTAVF